MNDSIVSFPLCPHFGECAGCIAPLSLKPPSVWEEISSFFLPFSIPALHAGNPLHWRHRAKMAVRGISTCPSIGLFKRFSHEVYPIPQCLVHHPHMNQAFEFVRKWIIKHGVIPYDEVHAAGELRYLQAVVQRESGKVQMSFVFNAQSDSPQCKRWRFLIEKLGEEHTAFWHSLWMNFNDRPLNTIFGPKWNRVWGEELLWENFNGVHVCYGPESFGQANLPLFERLLMRICELIPFQARVAEFYAGVGVIGLLIASKCQWVRCNEINSFAEAYFQQACAKLPPDIASRLSFFSGSAQDSLLLLDDATTVIVDPPRKGLDAHLFLALNNAQTVKQLVYMSCGWESFKRDHEKLCKDGWQVQSADGYLFFPGSNHVELLVSFIRS